MRPQQALITLYEATLGKVPPIEKEEAYQTLQELIDICSKPNSIKQKLDHIQDVIDCCYETDSAGKQLDNGWNNDVDCANEYLQDIKQAYSFRVEDTRIVNELQELFEGCCDIKKKVQELIDNYSKLEKSLNYLLNYLDKKFLLDEEKEFSRYLYKELLEEDIRRMLKREKE